MNDLADLGTRRRPDAWGRVPDDPEYGQAPNPAAPVPTAPPPAPPNVAPPSLGNLAPGQLPTRRNPNPPTLNMPRPPATGRPNVNTTMPGAGPTAPPPAPPPPAPPTTPPAPPADPSGDRQTAIWTWYESNKHLSPLDLIRAAYQKWLGRPGDANEHAEHLRNPGGIHAALQVIANGPEANARPLTPAAPPATTTDTTTTTGPLTRPDASLQGLYGGFDFNKDYDLDKSAKGTFFYASAAGAQDLRWQSKATSVAWFNQYILPAFKARGYTVDVVDGDRAFVHTREDPQGTWIDWVINIDGDPAKGEIPRLAWQDQSYGNLGTRIAGPPRPSNATGGGIGQAGVNAGGTAAPATAPPPADNGDGTVTARLTPAQYRAWRAQQLGTFGVTGRAHDRASLADLGQGRGR